MSNTVVEQKRAELRTFIERELAQHAPVCAVVGIGSIVTGRAHPGSDIDALVFLEPFDPYVTPAEFCWRPSDGTFHSIFADIQGIDFDLGRLDLARWRDPAFAWPEPRRAELATGWLAFDRDGSVAPLIAERTTYPDDLRIRRLDEAITWLDQHLGAGMPEQRWSLLGPAIAHDRLNAAYAYVAQALFAYNRRWQPWRNREMEALQTLPWRPARFEERILLALAPSGHDQAGYQARATTLRSLFVELLERLTDDGLYGADPIGEAFVRAHEEPGRAWNMTEWNNEHARRYGDKRV
ncbi:MAG TPA: nucleotidyltransferase domain-containing protein [Roseiflexaceae bacterium]|nr:nucleotidyltransferase domain-containing protein [Roseiflexaceae bacterium]